MLQKVGRLSTETNFQIMVYTVILVSQSLRNSVSVNLQSLNCMNTGEMAKLNLGICKLRIGMWHQPSVSYGFPSVACSTIFIFAESSPLNYIMALPKLIHRVYL